MRPYRHRALAPTLIVAGLALSGALAAFAHDDHPHGKEKSQESAAGHSHERASLHGGGVAMTKDHHFETVFSADGVRIYLYTADQAPMAVEKVQGTVTFRFQDGTKREVALVREVPAKGEAAVYYCPMHPDVVQKEPGKCAACGGMTLYTQDRLYGATDLSKVASGSMKAVVAVKGLAGKEREATFTETFTRETKPMKDDHAGHKH